MVSLLLLFLRLHFHAATAPSLALTEVGHLDWPRQTTFRGRVLGEREVQAPSLRFTEFEKEHAKRVSTKQNLRTSVKPRLTAYI